MFSKSVWVVSLTMLGAAAATPQVAGFETNKYDIFTMPANSFPAGINNTGTIVASGFESGYLVKNGTISPITLPVSDLGLVFANGVNDAGDIVGEYRNSGNFATGFAILHGAFQTLTDPDGRTLFPHDINAQRVIVGSASRPSERQVGFIFDNGRLTFVACPGINGQPEGAVFSGINRDGVIAGFCIGQKLRPFTYNQGAFTFFQYPGAEEARFFDINKDGDVVGDAFFTDSLGRKVIGFLYRKGVFYDISFPGTRQSNAVSINDSGDVLGQTTILHFGPNQNFPDLGFFNWVRSTKNLK